MTLHSHKVDDRTLVRDGDKPSQVPAGWEIAVDDADSIRVCGAHPWQSLYLVFANGDDYGTAMCGNPPYIGKNSLLQYRKKLNFSRLKIGKKWGGSGALIQDAQGVRSKPGFNTVEVLLRRRA
jgi:hypothetical protein